MEFDKFKKEVLNLSSSRQHRVTGSIGVYDIYKYIRKNKWFNLGQPITEHQFYSIIRNINNAFAEELINGNDINLPYRMGRIEIRKYDAKITFKDSRIKTNLPIDWNSTLKLWHENKECYSKKILIRAEEKEIFKVYYNKSKALYNNKGFIEYKPNRIIKRKLKDNIKQYKIDAFKL